MRCLAEKRRGPRNHSFSHVCIAFGPARLADAVDPHPIQIEENQRLRMPIHLVGGIPLRPRRIALRQDRAGAKVVQVVREGSEVEGANHRQVGSDHRDAPVAEGEQGVAGVLDRLQVSEFPGTFSPPAEGPQELAGCGKHPHFPRTPIAHHERAVRALLHVPGAIELVGRAAAGHSQIDERLRIDAPEAGIAPERPHRLDYLYPGAVPLDYERRARVTVATGGNAAQQERDDTPGISSRMCRHCHFPSRDIRRSQLRVSRSTCGCSTSSSSSHTPSTASMVMSDTVKRSGISTVPSQIPWASSTSHSWGRSCSLSPR